MHALRYAATFYVAATAGNMHVEGTHGRCIGIKFSACKVVLLCNLWGGFGAGLTQQRHSAGQTWVNHLSGP